MTPEESNQSRSKPCLFNYFFEPIERGFGSVIKVDLSFLLLHQRYFETKPLEKEL